MSLELSFLPMKVTLINKEITKNVIVSLTQGTPQSSSILNKTSMKLLLLINLILVLVDVVVFAVEEVFMVEDLKEVVVILVIEV